MIFYVYVYVYVCVYVYTVGNPLLDYPNIICLKYIGYEHKIYFKRRHCSEYIHYIR